MFYCCIVLVYVLSLLDLQRRHVAEGVAQGGDLRDLRAAEVERALLELILSLFVLSVVCR